MTSTAASVGTRILLVRHGETHLNASGRCQGQLDVPMSSRGERQVTQLRSRLMESGALATLTGAYSSPLGRARRTSELLLANTLPSFVDQDLMELSYGRWQGTTHEEWPVEASAQWRTDPWSLEFPDGESLSALRIRALRALTTIVRAHPGESVLVSAHGHFNRVILLEALGLSDLDFWSVRQPNAEGWWVSCTLDDGRLHLVSATRAGPAVTEATAQRAIDAKTKPLGALGALEPCAVRLAVLQQTLAPRIDQARICVFAADHGVAVEGVSAYPRAVTTEMMRNFARGGAAINVLARTNQIEIEVTDVGVDADISDLPSLRQAKVRRGSRNMLHEAALSEEELQEAMEAGAAAVQRAVRAGIDVIGLGEMGIGNTTAASAVLSALTGQGPECTVGSGTGLAGAALAHKRDVVARALDRQQLVGPASQAAGGRECLRRVGGLELAAMAGAALEASRHQIVILADGFISTVSVLAAARIAAETAGGAEALLQRVFLAHRSTETGHQLAISVLAGMGVGVIGPLLDLGMRLGEGTGAALALPVLRSAASIMTEMATFAEAGVSAGPHTAAHQSVDAARDGISF